MMKKTTSALAIAALLGTGAASAATFQINDTTTVGIGGAFYPFYTDTKNGEGNSVDDYGDFSRLIFTAEKAAVNGMTASLYYQLRPQQGLGDFAAGPDAANEGEATENDAGVRTHVAHATLSGDFGSVTYGKNDNLMYRYIDVVRDYNDAITFTFSNAITRTRILNYASPDFDGFGFEVEAELAGDGETVKENTGNSSSANVAAYADLDPVRLHAAYTAGNLQDSNSDGAYGVAAVTSIDVIDLSATYVNSKINDGQDEKIAGLYASTSYSFGSLHLGVQEVDVSNASNRTEVIGRATYDIADNVYTSVEYGNFDRADDEGNGFGVSLWYGF
ncbi:porin [Spiribacter roseus]|uniref:Porin n=1 Tax=Spiribacter roseus TaxID=1855875 RepID=A0ABV3RXD0_9GAMM